MMNNAIFETNREVFSLKQGAGYIYIFDFEEKNILSAILLHDIPFKIKEKSEVQKTSLVKLKMEKSVFKKQILSIQAALRNCESIHAQVLFKNLMLLNHSGAGIPTTSAELTDIIQLVVRYRS